MSAYAEHLKSPLWSRIKGDAAARSMGLCELCKSAARETHHIKYPKGYANDSAEHVLHVCSACHRRLHGMSELVTDRSLVEIRIDTFKNRQATVWVDERRWLWAPWETWGRVLVIPAGLQTQLLSGIHALAATQQKEWGEPFAMPDQRGTVWFRWHVIDDQLTKWAHRLGDRVGKADATRSVAQTNMSDDERLLHTNIAAIKKWGRDIQERALSGALTSGGGPVAPSNNVAALSQAMSLLAGVSQDHEVRLANVESTLAKDPDAFIDAKSFVIEKGLSSDRCVDGTRLTLQQWLGMELHKAGAEIGRPVTTRIEGTARVVEVNTYRRRDLASFVAKALKN